MTNERLEEIRMVYRKGWDMNFDITMMGELLTALDEANHSADWLRKELTKEIQRNKELRRVINKE